MIDLTAVSADDAAAHALLRSYLREVANPEQRAGLDAQHLVLSLARTDTLVRARLARRSLTDNHRLTGPVECFADGWHPIDATALGALIAAELSLLSGRANPEFAEQLQSSVVGTARAHQAVSARAATTPVRPARARYLASEQALWAGHRWHPTPKARDEGADEWRQFAPESAARLQLHWISLPAELVTGHDLGEQAAITRQALAGAPEPGEGRVAHPVHPWQWQRLQENPALRTARERGILTDLGPAGPWHDPTSSVRTLYGPDHFVKFSLGVRITNCVRRHAPYELSGAMRLAELTSAPLAELESRHPGVRLLRETGWRSLKTPASMEIPGNELTSDLAVIVREGLDPHLAPGTTPLLAAAVAAEYPGSPGQLAGLIEADQGVEWWRRYLRLIVPFVIEAYADHGIVTEPHLQNVVIGIGPENLPTQIFLRDFEGTKLLPSWRSKLAGCDARTTAGLCYDEDAGWQRIAYCLLVNNLAELIGALTDLGCDEGELWQQVYRQLRELSAGPGRHELRALLRGAPAPAKSNLLLRWARRADRSAAYVPVRLPGAQHLAGLQRVPA